MLHIHERLAIASLLFVCAGSVLAVDSSPAGPALRRDVGMAKVPLSSRWNELSAEQRDKVKASYQAMGAADEPPYPVDGMAPLMLKLQKGALAFGVTGQLDMAVNVDGAGAPHDVTIYTQPGSAQFGQYVAAVLVMTKYKPAVCGGHACTMSVPLQVTFTRQ
jgi:hypothetical protein